MMKLILDNEIDSSLKDTDINDNIEILKVFQVLEKLLQNFICMLEI